MAACADWGRLSPQASSVCPSASSFCAPKSHCNEKEGSAERNKGVPICCPSSLLTPLFFFQSVSLLSIQLLHAAYHYCPSLSLQPPFHFIPPSVHLLFGPVSMSLFILVPGPHPEYQLQPLQSYLLPYLPNVCVCV